MYILGISAFYHDSGAALIKDGEIVAAVQEERFTRKKHDSSLPLNGIKYCLQEAEIKLSELQNIIFYDKPFIKFERLLETYVSESPKGFKSYLMAMPVWLKEKLFLKSTIAKELAEEFDLIKRDVLDKILFTEHHQSHAASAFFPSPFEEAAILTIDGVGEWSTTSLAHGIGNRMEVLNELHFPHSLGLLYSAFTYYTGFKVNSGEYKVMGLAPYGEPKYVDLIKDNLIDLKADGSFKLNMDYFDYPSGLKMTNDKFANLFGGPARESESTITQREMDLARSVQDVTEEAILKIGHHARKATGSNNLCLAGGVALNCVANGKLLRENIFDNIWIQPAAGDAGGALGAALSAYYEHHEQNRKVLEGDSMQGSYLGPVSCESEIESMIKKYDAKAHKLYSDAELFHKVSDALASEKVVGWHEGRMEFGPRAFRWALNNWRPKK